MKRDRLIPFFAGMLFSAALFGGLTTALAAAGGVSFNAVNLCMGGEAIFGKYEYLETEGGQKIPSSILYTDESGGGNTYLPLAYIASLLEVPVSWRGDLDAVILGEDQSVAIKPEVASRELAEQWLVDGDYPRNSKGETYGPELYDIVGASPDLLAATGVGGVEGYIRQEESAGPPDAQPGQDIFIPLYDWEGNIIGAFPLQAPDPIPQEVLDRVIEELRKKG